MRLRIPTPAAPRRGLLIIAALLALILVASALWSYLSVFNISAALNNGQAAVYMRGLGQLLQGLEPPIKEAQLQQLLDQEWESGLRHVALMTVEGELLVEVGEATAPLPRVERSTRMRLVRLDGGRVRMIHRLPGVLTPGTAAEGGLKGGGPAPPPRGPPPGDGRAPPRGPAPFDEGILEVLVPPPEGDPWSQGGPPPGAGGPGPEEGGASRRRPDPGPFLVCDFVPIMSHEMERRALTSLIASTLAALALSVAAGVLWRLSLRADEERGRRELQQRLTVLGEMSAVLAHEIRNPLASLKGHAQLLAERVEEQEPLRRKAARILDETHRLEHLTNGLLDFARTAKLERASVDPAALARGCVEASEGRVELDLDDAPERFSMDGPKIEQVLTNLLSNAHQAAPEAAVELRVATERGGLVLEVRDHGPGVPAAERERIFEPFHTTRTRGTGLGLAISRRIVEQHGGRLEVHDGPDGGACFRVTLPPPPSA